MFKTVDVQLKGFKYPKCKLQELTIAQVIEAGKIADDETKAFIYFIEKGLRNNKGDLVFNENYTIDEFLESSPQSYMNVLADAVARLNNNDDAEALATAKN